MRVVITGGSSGIGQAVASSLHTDGHDVVVVSRSEPPAGSYRTWIRADLSDLSAVDTVAYEVGPLDVLIHCAASCVRSAVGNTSPEEIQSVFNLNVIAPVLLTRALTPMLADRIGCVIGVSSLAGRIGSPGNAVFSATKFALDGYLEAAAYELAHIGIRTRVIVPLYVKTSFMKSASLQEPAPHEPYAAFEEAARARFDASLDSAPVESLGEAAQVIAATALDPGAAWFDRLVIGNPSTLKHHHALGPSLWHDDLTEQLRAWFPKAH